ncbi:Multivesicular body subunit 12B [Labeo rohita]|uniref:Multivesicular body subunit 12B n=1 Tax=Labeo rohita TaxID=84645 RepID=A0ABQ8MF62_LABRO|nr:Multivesicular body subunit 12B [Labeo rohita]
MADLQNISVGKTEPQPEAITDVGVLASKKEPPSGYYISSSFPLSSSPSVFFLLSLSLPAPPASPQLLPSPAGCLWVGTLLGFCPLALRIRCTPHGTNVFSEALFRLAFPSITLPALSNCFHIQAALPALVVRWHTDSFGAWFLPVAQTTDGFDANLWKDSIFKSKVTRYLCFTRAATSKNKQLCNVVVDMKLIDLKDCLPEGFTPIQDTTDTQEQALRKERLCVKLVPRHSADTAICDVVIQGKSKQGLTNYTFMG